MVLALTKTPMLVEGGGSAEHLSTVFTLNLGAAVCMHPFVTAQVRELGIRFVTHLTWENTHDWLILLTYCFHLVFIHSIAVIIRQLIRSTNKLCMLFIMFNKQGTAYIRDSQPCS